MRGELARQIEQVLAGTLKKIEGVSLSIPVTATERGVCIFCSAQVARVQLDSGQTFNAKLEADAQGVRHVEVTHPHLCDEFKRWQEFHHREEDAEGWTGEEDKEPSETWESDREPGEGQE
ncbi:MAG: hypothetical protein WB952_05810 [Terriglobales bacterium]